MNTTSLYTAAPIRAALGQTLRPGGEGLTRRLLDLIGSDLSADALILDAGCGCGATLELLRERGCNAIGLDLNSDFLGEARDARGAVARADLAQIPLADHSVDLVLCECVWNLTEKTRVLAEFARILAPSGTLLLADIFTRGKPGLWPVHCCFAQATDLETVLSQVRLAEFDVEMVEDHSPLLARTAADFVFRHGSLRGFWQAVTGDPTLAETACATAHTARPGLFLLKARRCAA